MDSAVIKYDIGSQLVFKLNRTTINDIKDGSIK